ncbi:hypothetical protein [Burkholderia territorii]|uniref:AprA-related methyltransferase n=1 Tax=Burkholderia territorii TaxID=1503055 RepID=UPI000AF55ED6|nr:hypothetical protein [Burkholderia territorii]
MAYIQSSYWANGIVLVPTLTRLVFAGMFSSLSSGQSRALQTFSPMRRPNRALIFGQLCAPLNLLGAAGWFAISGSGDEAEYKLAAIGKFIVSCVERISPVLQLMADAPSTLQHVHALCHRTRVNNVESTLVAQLARMCVVGWPLPTPVSELERETIAQIRIAMDGLLLGPTWVALDMPVFELREGTCCRQVAPSILDKLAHQPNGVAVGAWAHVEPVVLRAAWSLMEQFGMAEVKHVHVHPTDAGAIYWTSAAPFAGLTASYFHSFACLDELLFGHPQSFGSARDARIGRAMNLYGARSFESDFAPNEMATKVLHEVFDHTPLDFQSEAIGDIRCEDGCMLKQQVRYIITATRRGRRLEDYPLVVVAAGNHEFARARASRTLLALHDVPGVQVRVILADVLRPDLSDAAMVGGGQSIKWPGGRVRPSRQNDLLHTCIPLNRNRHLGIRSEDAAEAKLDHHLRTVDRSQVRATVDQFFFDILTVSEQAKLPVMLDQIKRAFRAVYIDTKGAMPGYVAAADLIECISRWKRYGTGGFLKAEEHSPLIAGFCGERQPIAVGQVCAVAQPLSVLSWHMDSAVGQLKTPFNQFKLALTSADLRPPDSLFTQCLLDEFQETDFSGKPHIVECNEICCLERG